MLSELTIRDFAIIDHLHLEFTPGFSVLTGETGAGKSIIIDAVSLLLGGRGEPDLIRAGAGQAVIEGVFSLDDETTSKLQPLLERDGLEGDDPHELVLGREIRREGRNVCRVNGRAVSLKVLGGIGEWLVDIHGQTEHLSLMRAYEHVDFLDRFGGLWPLREQVGALVRQLRSVRKELTDLRRDERELVRRVDLLRYQVNEIESARLRPGEEQELSQERVRLANAEQLAQLAEEAYLALYEGEDDRSSAIDLVQGAARAVAGLARLDASSAGLLAALSSISDQLDDLARTLRDYRDHVEFSPERLEQVEERLALIRSLERKYGDGVEEVVAFGTRACRELDAIEHSGERIAELEADEERLLHAIGRSGAELSTGRRAASETLAAGIEAQLDELSMARARFGTDIAWRDDPQGAYVEGRRVAFDATGLDRVEFLIAPNVGEGLKPLVRIASGGETSRLMLALKTVLALADRTPTLIFDEIDAGIGGRVGAVVGQKLWALTAGDGQAAHPHQVLCVTHLPQLASYGDQHLQISKGIVGDRTVTEAHLLEGEAREEEIAAMLGAITDRTHASAREMLASSEEDKHCRRIGDRAAPRSPGAGLCPAAAFRHGLYLRPHRWGRPVHLPTAIAQRPGLWTDRGGAWLPGSGHRECTAAGCQRAGAGPARRDRPIARVGILTAQTGQWHAARLEAAPLSVAALAPAALRQSGGRFFRTSLCLATTGANAIGARR
jgi:DNA repair protein RecN (Recombination protein N)